MLAIGPDAFLFLSWKNILLWILWLLSKEEQQKTDSVLGDLEDPTEKNEQSKEKGYLFTSILQKEEGLSSWLAPTIIVG